MRASRLDYDPTPCVGPYLWVDDDGRVYRERQRDTLPVEINWFWLTDHQAAVVQVFLDTGVLTDRHDRRTFRRAMRRLLHPEAWFAGRGRRS